MDSYNMYLYNERMSLGLSENKFAKKLGIGYIKYHLIENGYLKPNNKEVEIISSALNVDYSEYLYGERSYPAQKEHKRNASFYKVKKKTIAKINENWAYNKLDESIEKLISDQTTINTLKPYLDGSDCNTVSIAVNCSGNSFDGRPVCF